MENKGIEDSPSANNRSSSKVEAGELSSSTRSTQKKKKAPKLTNNGIESEPIDKIKSEETLQNIDNESIIYGADQEIPKKPKKKRAPKIEQIVDPDQSSLTEEPTKNRKARAPIADDHYEAFDSPVIRKSKEKQSKKSKRKPETEFDSFENTEATNFDDINTDIPDVTDENAPFVNFDGMPSSENQLSDYQQAIIDSYQNLAANVSFAQYLGNEQWDDVHQPKSARIDQRSLLQKMISTNNGKDEKLSKLSPAPKASLFNRIRSGVNTLVLDPKNIIFGQPPNYDVVYFEDDADDVDTDNLNRYAQQLRELEDRDREFNPEFLVLRDGKTVYGIHESDADGNVKLATRKPIYDRFADQTVDEQAEKKNLLSRFKRPFTRGKNGQDSRATSSTMPTSRST